MRNLVPVQVRPIATCEGPPRALGRAQGEQLRDRIRGAVQDLEQVEPYQLLKPRWMPAPLFRLASEQKATRKFGSAIQSLCPSMADRLLGISEGSGVPLRSLWLIQAMEAMLGAVGAYTHVLTPHLGGCTALAVRNGGQSGSGPLLAHNFDYIAPVRPYFAIRESRPSNGYRSVDFLVAPLCGAIDGVNEAGLAVSYNYAMTTDHGTPAPTLSMRISGLLAGCASVASAIEWLAIQPRWGGGLLMLVDATGDLASVELTNREIEVRRPEPGRNWLAHTNKLSGAKTVAVEIDRRAVFDCRAPGPLRGTNVLESSIVRYARLEMLLNSASRLDSAEIARILSDHGQDGLGSLNTICMHSSYWSTSASLQLDPVERRLRVSFSPTCQAEYHEYALT